MKCRTSRTTSASSSAARASWPNADFNSGTRNQPLGAPKAGFSADLDALAAYVNSLSQPRPQPEAASNGTMTANATAGLALFTSLGCQACHSGPAMTDGQRHDVGTHQAIIG